MELAAARVELALARRKRHKYLFNNGRAVPKGSKEGPFRDSPFFICEVAYDQA